MHYFTVMCAMSVSTNTLKESTSAGETLAMMNVVSV